MSEQYLPVRESLGYKNTKMALRKIFLIDLDEIEIDIGENEDFSFQFNYRHYDASVAFTSTGKGIQFEVGEGGMVDIYFNYSRDPFFH